MPTSMTPTRHSPVEALKGTITDHRWIDVISFINHLVRDFRSYIRDLPNAIDDRPPYIMDWIQFHSDVYDQIRTNNDTKWHKLALKDPKVI